MDIKCSGFCVRNVIKFIIYYYLSSFFYNHSRSYIFITPLFMLFGFVFFVLSLWIAYKMIVNRAELSGSLLIVRYWNFKSDWIELQTDTNYKIQVKNGKIIIQHYGNKVELKKYYSNFNKFRYYISYYERR